MMKSSFLKEFDMELLKLEIPKSKLLSVPKKERVFFVQAGNLLNDLSMLQKLVLFTTNTKTTNKTVRTAQNLQALCLIRIQAGKLDEGWELLQKNYFGAGLSKDYDRMLSQSEKQCLDNIKKYFGSKSNLISLVRDYTFHYFTSSEQISQLIDDAPPSEIFEVFMSDFYGNCVFSMSNVLVTFAILKSTGITHTEKAMGKLLRDVQKVTKWFGDFLGRCLLVFVEKHLGLESSKVEIPEPPDIKKVTLPYFIKG